MTVTHLQRKALRALKAGITYSRTGQGFISGSCTTFFSSRKRPHWLWPTQPPFQSISTGFTPWVKRTGIESDFSLPPSPKVRNEWSYISIPLTCLNGAQGGKFTLPLWCSHRAWNLSWANQKKTALRFKVTEVLEELRWSISDKRSLIVWGCALD
jgi:hypothetical protein